MVASSVPNDRVNFAVIGLHGRGNAHLSGIRGCQRGQVTTICDVDRRERDRVAGQFKRRNENSQGRKRLPQGARIQ